MFSVRFLSFQSLYILYSAKNLLFCNWFSTFRMEGRISIPVHINLLHFFKWLNSHLLNKCAIIYLVNSLQTFNIWNFKFFYFIFGIKLIFKINLSLCGFLQGISCKINIFLCSWELFWGMNVLAGELLSQGLFFNCIKYWQIDLQKVVLNYCFIYSI